MFYTIDIRKTLTLAIVDNAVSTVAYIMNSLMAAFIEGEDDEAGELFNKTFHTLSFEMKKKTLHTCVFEKVANNLAEKYGIAKPWRQVGEFSWEYIGTEKNPYEK